MWDKPLLEDRLTEWQVWRDLLQDLKQLHIPRPYTATSLSKAEHIESCVFSDASTKAISTVAYLRAANGDGQIDVGFIMGKAKLAPQSEPTIPRLELCAAVLAVEMAELILEEIDLKPDAIKFYCDSKVVLGYIYNETKRFYVYVYNHESSVSGSSQNQNSGSTYRPNRTRRTMVLAQSKHLVLARQLGSLDQASSTSQTTSTMKCPSPSSWLTQKWTAKYVHR